MTVECPGLGASASYGSTDAATSKYVCVCALHGFRTPRVIWSTSLRQSGSSVVIDSSMRTTLLTANIDSNDTVTSLNTDEVTISGKPPPFCADVFVSRGAPQTPAFCFRLERGTET